MFLALSVTALTLMALMTMIIDPYFLYHKPCPGLSYAINNERYQNYGIARNFDYNAMIVGTSMTENFKPSELDRLFGVKSVKLPFSGGSHCEVNELLQFAFAHNPDIKMVIRSIDLFKAFEGKDDRDYPEDSYPAYLYDDKRLNDIRYLLNGETFADATVRVLIRTLLHKPSTTLDEYANWNDEYPFGPQGVQANYSRNKVVYTGNNDISEEEYSRIEENIRVNILAIAREHPETMFYLYISPYSIYFFDYVNQMGELDRYLKVEEFILKLLLGQENIKVFSFFTEYDVISDPYHYRDVGHHDQEVNSMILEWMKENRGEITEENIEGFCNTVWEYYHQYPYDELFEKDGYTIRDPKNVE